MATSLSSFFFFNDTATTEIYTLSLHDALPISVFPRPDRWRRCQTADGCDPVGRAGRNQIGRHTSELQSQSNLVCRLLLEKKKKSVQQRITNQLYPAHLHRGARPHDTQLISPSS